MAEVGSRQSAYPTLQPRGWAEAARVGSGFPFGCLTGRWSLCLLAATFTAVLPIAAQAEQWPTTDWEPVCYEDRLSTSACDLEDDGVAVVVEQLREASRYFQTLGFRPPVIARPNGSDPARPYPVYLEEDRFYPGEVRSLEATGAYYPPEFLRVAYGDYFAYDPEEFFAFGTESDGNMYTATHELFHAIQEAYGKRELFDGKGGEWIVEGTAVAAEAVRTENIDFFPLTPFLDYPLYALRTRGGQESSYLSYPFWLYVADRYGGGLPDGIAVLHDFFRGAATYSGRRKAIDIVDGSLRQFNEDGLYDIYPAFIAEYGADERRYMEVTRHDVLPPEDAVPALYNLEIAGSVAPVAAKPYRIRVVGMPASENGPASAVEIRLEADDPDALHLVVDETRFDRVESGRGGSRNVFTGEIGGEAAPQGTSLEEFFVRVVNVSRDPAAYKDQDFRLIVTVFHEQIEIDGAPSSGNRSVDDPPVALSGTARGQYWGPYPSRQVRDAGLRAPCMLTFGVVDEDDTSSINFSLLQDGPLQAGDYGIAAYDPKEITGELDRILNFAGRAVVDFTLSENHPLIGEYGMVYNGQGGVLRVDSISADWITGSARIAGAWSGRRPTYLPHDAPPAGPRNLEITLDFSIQNRPISSSLNIGSCVASPN